MDVTDDLRTVHNLHPALTAERLQRAAELLCRDIRWFANAGLCILGKTKSESRQPDGRPEHRYAHESP
jgi:hypothetical protein